MTGGFPSPNLRNPVRLADGTDLQGTVFLRPAINHPQIDVGAYTYASSFDPPDDWAARLAPYLFDFSPERLVIGKFCQIADGVVFVTASANHRYDGFSTFPFAVFDGGRRVNRPSLPDPGADTIIGNDVWFGQGARVLPGTRIGNGVIIGAGAVVKGNIPDYCIVAGNPARVVRRRFDAPTINRLLGLCWWDWPIDVITNAEAAICGAELSALEQVARDQASRGGTT